MAYGTYGKDVLLAGEGSNLFKCSKSLIYGESVSGKLFCWYFMAVGNNHLLANMLIDPRCAKGYYDGGGFFEEVSGCLYGAVCVGEELFRALSGGFGVKEVAAVALAVCAIDERFYICFAEWCKILSSN